MGKQGEGRELSILFLCPREYLRTRFGLCVPFSHLSLRAVWCTGTCRPPPATPALAVCGRCERFAASPQPTASVAQRPRSRARCQRARRPQRRRKTLSQIRAELCPPGRGTLPGHPRARRCVGEAAWGGGRRAGAALCKGGGAGGAAAARAARNGRRAPGAGPRRRGESGLSPSFPPSAGLPWRRAGGGGEAVTEGSHRAPPRRGSRGGRGSSGRGRNGLALRLCRAPGRRAAVGED